MVFYFLMFFVHRCSGLEVSAICLSLRHSSASVSSPLVHPRCALACCQIDPTHPFQDSLLRLFITVPEKRAVLRELQNTPSIIKANEDDGALT